MRNESQNLMANITSLLKMLAQNYGDKTVKLKFQCQSVGFPLCFKDFCK